MIFTTHILVAIAMWISGVHATHISPIETQGQYSTAVHSKIPEDARSVSPSRRQDPDFDTKNAFHISNKDHRYQTLRELRGFAKQGGTFRGVNADFPRENPSLASAHLDEVDVDAGSRFATSNDLGGEEVLNPRQILDPSASTLSISSTLPGEDAPTSVTKNPFSSISSADEEPTATNSITSTISSLEQSQSRDNINGPNAATSQSSSSSVGSQSVVTSTKDGSMPSFSRVTASTGKSGTTRSSDTGSVSTRSGHGKLKKTGASSLALNYTGSSSQGGRPSSRISAMSSLANSVRSPSSQSTGPSSSNLPRSATSLTSLIKTLFMSDTTTNSPSLVGSRLPSQSNSVSITSSQSSLTVLDPKNANAFLASTSLFSRSSSSVSPEPSRGTSQQSSTIGLASSRSKASTKIPPSSSTRTSWLLTSSTSVIISPSSSKLIKLSTAMNTAIRSGLSSSIHSSSPTITKSVSVSQSGKASAPISSKSSIAHQASITGTSIYGRSTKSLESTSGKSSSASLAGVTNNSSLARGGRSSAVGPSNSKFTGHESSSFSTSIFQSSRSLISGPNTVSSYAEVITSGGASMSSTSNSASSYTSRPSAARIITISQSSQSRQVTFSKSSEAISAGVSRAVADTSSNLISAKFQKTAVPSISSQISFQRTPALYTSLVSATAGSFTKIIQGGVTRSSSVLPQTTRPTSQSASGHSQDSGHSQGNNQVQENGAEVGQDQGTGKQDQSQGHQAQDGGQIQDGSQGQGISQPQGIGQSQGSGPSQGNTGNGQPNGQSQGDGEIQGGQNGGQRPAIDAPPKVSAGDRQGPDSGPQKSPSNGGSIQLDPESVIKISSKVNPSSGSKTDGSRPIVTNNVNFYDGTLFINGPIDSDVRVAQAQFINGALPSSIQNAFNSNEINYYDPGTGDFYYAKHCNKIGCSIVQIGRSCGCYTNATDHQQHYLLAESTTSLELLIPNQSQTIPNALDYMVQNGENNQDIANIFGIPLELLRAANRQISNFDAIYSGQSLIVPAQAYLIMTGDSLSSIAAHIQSTVAVLLALNPEITHPDYLLPGYFIRTPARLPNVPFAYTVHQGDALGNLANLYGITVEALENLNPQILNKEEIFTKEIIRIPSYLPFEGTLNYNDKCYTCNTTATLKKRATLRAGPKFPLVGKGSPKPLAGKLPIARRWNHGF